MIDHPSEDEYAPFYAGYVALVPEKDVLAVLAAQPAELSGLAAGVPAANERHRYAPGKWSLREVLGHVGDSERVFAYRALCVSRGDPASLPGFDENDYVAASGFDARPLASLAAEFSLLREANLEMLRGFGAEHWRRAGTANGSRVTARALAFIMAGHVRHHLRVLRDRYREAFTAPPAA